MDQFFLSDKSGPSIVRQKKKYATFTIKEIGGPTEIVEWRKQQEAKLAAYGMTLKDRDDRISAFRAGNEVDAPKLIQGNWQNKLSFAMSERKRLAEPEIINRAPTVYDPGPPKSLFQRFNAWLSRLWKSAKF